MHALPFSHRIMFLATVIDCEPLSNPVHGRVNTPTGTMFNSLAMYSCNVGYMIAGVSIRVCSTDRVWLPDAPTCQGIELQFLYILLLQHVENFHLHFYHSLPYFTYYCNSNFVLTSITIHLYIISRQ